MVGHRPEGGEVPVAEPISVLRGEPVLSKDLDGSDFVVTIVGTGSEKIITIKMNIYAVSETAYQQLRLESV